MEGRIPACSPSARPWFQGKKSPWNLSDIPGRHYKGKPKAENLKRIIQQYHLRNIFILKCDSRYCFLFLFTAWCPSKFHPWRHRSRLCPSASNPEGSTKKMGRLRGTYLSGWGRVALRYRTTIHQDQSWMGPVSTCLLTSGCSIDCCRYFLCPSNLEDLRIHNRNLPQELKWASTNDMETTTPSSTGSFFSSDRSCKAMQSSCVWNTWLPWNPRVKSFVTSL